jgi:ATP synthase protein I
MNEELKDQGIPQEDDESPSRFSREVGIREERKLKARRREIRSVWTGFGFFGLIGWSIVVPTLIGAAIGRWLDRAYPGERSWTLAFLVAGLALGCFNAWRWIAKELREIENEEKEGAEDE